MNLRLLAVGAVAIGLTLASCGSPPTTTTIPLGVVASPQATVDALAAAQPSGRIPDHFRAEDFAEVVRNEDDFDVNTYFTVLTHLSMEPGWVVDYLYRMRGMGGSPFVHARPADQGPYTSVEEYVAATAGGAAPDAKRDYSREYLAHIKVDDTREGYFQFVSLMIMGGQFYLDWHAAYNDTTLVCDQEALEATMKAAGSAFESDGLPGDVQKAARRLDLTPTVTLLDDSTAVVRVVTFSKWGGFIESRYTVSRQFPHSILDEVHTTLVEYDCGVQF